MGALHQMNSYMMTVVEFRSKAGESQWLFLVSKIANPQNGNLEVTMIFEIKIF